MPPKRAAKAKRGGVAGAGKPIRPPEPPLDSDPSLGGGALAAGSAAAGLARVREGFAESGVYDRLFALGWPNFVLVGGPATTLEDRAALSGVGAGRRRVWPECALGPVVRFWALPWEVAFGMDSHGRGGAHDERGRPVPSADGLRVLDDTTPLREEEAAAAVRDLLQRTSAGVALTTSMLRWCEAAIGTVPLVAIVCAELEGWPIARWRGTHHHAYQAVFELGSELDRLPSADSDRVRARLADVFRQTVRGAFGASEMPPRDSREVAPPLRALDIVLHGVTGAARSGWGRPNHPMARSELGWVRGGGAFIVDAMRKGRAEDPTPDVRRVFEGGDEVVDLEAASWRKTREPDDQRVVIETYGVLATPRIVPWFVDMAEKSRVRPDARGWFRRRRAFAEPELRRLAEGTTPLAEAAAAIYREVSGTTR